MRLSCQHCGVDGEGEPLPQAPEVRPLEGVDVDAWLGAVREAHAGGRLIADVCACGGFRTCAASAEHVDAVPAVARELSWSSGLHDWSGVSLRFEFDVAVERELAHCPGCGEGAPMPGTCDACGSVWTGWPCGPWTVVPLVHLVGRRGVELIEEVMPLADGRERLRGLMDVQRKGRAGAWLLIAIASFVLVGLALGMGC